MKKLLLILILCASVSSLLADYCTDACQEGMSVLRDCEDKCDTCDSQCGGTKIDRMHRDQYESCMDSCMNN